MAIYLNNEQDEIPVDTGFWQARAEAIADAAGVEPDTEWSLTFVDDGAMRTFNREYRGYDRPTDVLSFSQLEGDEAFPHFEDHPILGDVVVALPTARRQAAERGHSFEAELSLLITHGLLHLLGEDHDVPERKAQMWARQGTILDGLGVAIQDYGD
ncbi:MAG TPA: rRNA maturation RNase YbeY [Oscillatoriaceae cyanobacterium]